MKQKVYGFTLVEVILVIAIGGLIFAMTFLILPNLIANQQDSQRRDDMTTFIDTLKNYQKNNSRGNLPGVITGSLTDSPTQKELLDNGKTVLVDGDDVVEDRERKGESRKYKEASWEGFYRDYFLSAFADPEGYNYNLAISNCQNADSKKLDIEAECNSADYEDFKKEGNTFSKNNFTVHVILGATCDGAIPIKSANSRRVAVVYKLERTDAYCYND